MRFKNGFSNGFEPGDDEDQWRGYYLIKKDKKNHFVFFCNSFSARRWRFEKKKKFFLVKISTASRPRNGDISSIQRTFFFFFSLFFFLFGGLKLFRSLHRSTWSPRSSLSVFFSFIATAAILEQQTKIKKKKGVKKREREGMDKKKRNQIRIFFSPSKKIK